MAQDLRMMNLTLHVQGDLQVNIVKEKTGFDLERSPQGVYVGKGEEGIKLAAESIYKRITTDKYSNILVGGGTGLVAQLVQMLIGNNINVTLWEFENVKHAQADKTVRPFLQPVSIRKILDT
jgi:hypothetical protein